MGVPIANLGTNEVYAEVIVGYVYVELVGRTKDDDLLVVYGWTENGRDQGPGGKVLGNTHSDLYRKKLRDDVGIGHILSGEPFGGDRDGKLEGAGTGEGNPLGFS